MNASLAGEFDDRDLHLITAVIGGDRAAWNDFVRRHERWVRGVVFATLGRAGLVDDVVQLVWTRVWRQVGTLTDPTKWRGWLYRIARNAAIDSGESAARRRQHYKPLEIASEAPTANDGPVETLSRRETQERVLSAIQGLPAIYREPFILRHLEDWSYAEIAATMELPIDTVETRLVRARRLLRDALGDLRPGQALVQRPARLGGQS